VEATSQAGSNPARAFRPGLLLTSPLAGRNGVLAPARGAPWRWGDMAPAKTPPLTGSYLTFRTKKRIKK